TTPQPSIQNMTVRFNVKEGMQRLTIIWGAALFILLLSAGGAHAVNLFWDAGNTNNGAAIDPGSGSWNTDTTTNLNWNNGSANVSWTQTSTTSGTMGAIFNGPGAAPGTYQVAVDGTQVAATN